MFAVVADDKWIAGRVHWQPMLVVAQAEFAAWRVVFQAQFATVEHSAIVVTQQRQQYLALEDRVEWLPVDVKEITPGRSRAIFQHIQPPRVVSAHDAHVIGHDVEDLAQVMDLERCHEIIEVL